MLYFVSFNFSPLILDRVAIMPLESPENLGLLIPTWKASVCSDFFKNVFVLFPHRCFVITLNIGGPEITSALWTILQRAVSKSTSNYLLSMKTRSLTLRLQYTLRVSRRHFLKAQGSSTATNVLNIDSCLSLTDTLWLLFHIVLCYNSRIQRRKSGIAMSHSEDRLA